MAIINRLIARGHAYLASGSEGREVLFSVSSMPAYGKLSNRKLDEQIEGARVAVEAHKRNAADFVLWKESSADQPGWPGVWRCDHSWTPRLAYRMLGHVDDEAARTVRRWSGLR